VPDLQVPDAVVAGLWLALGLWAFWWGVPLAVASIESTRYANGGEENPVAIEPDGSDPAYAAAFAALRQLGYEPVGPAWMRLTFCQRSWVVRAKVRVFRKPATGRFAYLQEWAALPGWHQLVFTTYWADGSITVTARGTQEARHAAGGYDAEVLPPTIGLAAFEARHAERESAREAQGARRDPDLSLATLLAATERHAYVSTVVPTAHEAWAELSALLILSALLGGITLLGLGQWPLVPPALGLAVLAAIGVSHASQRRRLRAYLSTLPPLSPDPGR
jgi:hypothetical protein